MIMHQSVSCLQPCVNDHILISELSPTLCAGGQSHQSMSCFKMDSYLLFWNQGENYLKTETSNAKWPKNLQCQPVTNTSTLKVIPIPVLHDNTHHLNGSFQLCKLPVTDCWRHQTNRIVLHQTTDWRGCSCWVGERVTHCIKLKKGCGCWLQEINTEIVHFF